MGTSHSKHANMGGCIQLSIALACLSSLAVADISSISNRTETAGKERAFSLFSIVQFPNAHCTASSSSTTFGTCYTATECSSVGGTADGNCAAGFGVCCTVVTSTCGSTISTNTTYIRNPNFPSTYTPSSTSTCTFTFNKVSTDICQLRLDFQTFSGFDETAGSCTDKLVTEGQTGSNPPTICGTNTGYHMYTEFGVTSTDTISLTITYGSTTTAKAFNILTRQVSCDATWKAPTDCVQYYTGTTGTIQSYNFGGAQLLQGMYYTNCIRTEFGYCGVQYKESTGQTPDAFDVGTIATAISKTGSCTAADAAVYIPNLSPDGIKSMPPPIGSGLESYLSSVCGSNLGQEGKTTSLTLITRDQPFIVGVYTSDPATLTAPTTGFSLDYTQVPC